MIEGTGTFVKKTVKAKGKEYETLYLYIPVNVATDGLNMFKPGDKAHITIDSRNNRLIIEKEKK